MSFWTFLSGQDDDTVKAVDTVPSGTHTENPTSSKQPTVVIRTDADGSVRTIINTHGGNYNERINGDYIQGSDTRKKTR